jgi:hypothetical protein
MGNDLRLGRKRTFDSEEEFTRQIKVSLPVNYLCQVDAIAKDLRIPKRFIYWGAVGNYIDICRQVAGKVRE